MDINEKKRKSKLKIRLSAAIVGVLLIFILTSIYFVGTKPNNKNSLIFTTFLTTDVKTTVSSTGTLNPKGIVEIGTQVSGVVENVYVNYNDIVKKNQLIATLDTNLLKIAVNQAEADLIKTKSQYELTLKDLKSKEELFKNALISEYEIEAARVSKDAGYAQYLSAQAGLDKAKTNLDYAYIKSPIDGVVIDKSIEEGQTVAASLSSPTLFIIAEGLEKMEIHALVDESDVGKIKSGQKAVYTVEAYDGKEFYATVREIRMNPTTVSNVVNYVIVLDSNNKDNLLFPGMTANIDFIIREEIGVTAVSNRATRFAPPEDMIRGFDQKNRAQRDKRKSDNLWYLNENGEITALPVTFGISDDQNTQIIGLPEDKMEIKIIVGIRISDKKTTATKENANTNSNRRFRGRMPPMF
ncbi:MAG TPA: efflux RND transporter periplasmic adaptor subunit [Spirochaetota bacterium]|nr:efflux RND transporter periplasmic adaptor subunit [Spirochaetota bacterium]HOS33438.1 efflux RND transporter periplasmic adaptor subunit [Spirochaetota bacterium]HOS54852.1 efflux RND transporter periplasmic adaptor subunit [Spirochaetota bacterium]HQF77774.1 efflux RND transporter periplasmic adaptor subunit [Spirochaetota bacterium]HQH31419.1 efflux RND transporter periplasmic adaptor subunit [Spirochaetota bacterium]